MFSKYFIGFILIPLSILFFPFSSRAVSDSIQTMPFTENWGSGTFTANSWTFLPTQGNWAISTTLGNPAPSAVYTVYPESLSYSYTLQSPWIEGRGLRCDFIYLDFDLKIETGSNSGLGLFTVQLIFDSVVKTIHVFHDSASSGWRHFRYSLSTAEGSLFRTYFKASGQGSPGTTRWLLDNISITRQCRPPRNLYSINGGVCDFNINHCRHNLSWSPPDCSNVHLVDIIFDDGTYEIQVFYNGGSAPVGNLFPVGPTMTGKLISFDVMLAATCITGSTSVDVYDTNYNLLGSSQPFEINAGDTWTTVTLDSIPFTGQFLGMITIGTGYVNGLALDQNGPFASSDLTWIYYNGVWETLNQAAPGVFGPTVALLRAHALIPDKKKAPGSGKNPASMDTTVFLGYNLYRRRDYPDYDSVFIKLNQSPWLRNYFRDSTHCQAHYTVTALYSDGCESVSNDTIRAGPCIVGVAETPGQGLLRLSPNPACSRLGLHSQYRMGTIMISDLKGLILKKTDAGMERDFTMDVSDLPAGMYFVRVETQTTCLTAKFMVVH
jgi:hypothetical protein